MSENRVKTVKTELSNKFQIFNLLIISLLKSENGFFIMIIPITYVRLVTFNLFCVTLPYGST